MARHKYRRKHADICKKFDQFNHHHIKAKSRGGNSKPDNIIIWNVESHRMYHALFGNMTLIEASDWIREVDLKHRDGTDLDIRLDRPDYD